MLLLLLLLPLLLAQLLAVPLLAVSQLLTVFVVKTKANLKAQWLLRLAARCSGKASAG